MNYASQQLPLLILDCMFVPMQFIDFVHLHSARESAV